MTDDTCQQPLTEDGQCEGCAIWQRHYVELLGDYTLMRQRVEEAIKEIKA